MNPCDLLSDEELSLALQAQREMDESVKLARHLAGNSSQESEREMEQLLQSARHEVHRWRLELETGGPKEDVEDSLAAALEALDNINQEKMKRDDEELARRIFKSDCEEERREQEKSDQELALKLAQQDASHQAERHRVDSELARAVFEEEMRAESARKEELRKQDLENESYARALVQVEKEELEKEERSRRLRIKQDARAAALLTKSELQDLAQTLQAEERDAELARKFAAALHHAEESDEADIFSNISSDDVIEFTKQRVQEYLTEGKTKTQTQSGKKPGTTPAQVGQGQVPNLVVPSKGQVADLPTFPEGGASATLDVVVEFPERCRSSEQGAARRKLPGSTVQVPTYAKVSRLSRSGPSLSVKITPRVDKSVGWSTTREAASPESKYIEDDSSSMSTRELLDELESSDPASLQEAAALTNEFPRASPKYAKARLLASSMIFRVQNKALARAAVTARYATSPRYENRMPECEVLVDLHYLYVDEALMRFKAVVQLAQDFGWERLKVVCGDGNHSPGKIPRIANKVTVLVACWHAEGRYISRYNKVRGTFLIQLRPKED